MDKDRVSGKVKDIGGRAKRQAGEWTGDKDLQAEGTKDQIEGKGENIVGKVKDAGRKIADDARLKMREAERNREDKKKKVA